MSPGSTTNPGPIPRRGYYKVDYFNNQTFRDALADGHTLEVLVMFDADADGEKEIKPLSSMQGGGTGFLITKKDRGTELTFLPHLTSGGWQWTRSGVTPQRAKYYHLVGVWDKTAQKSRIYVNGEQKAEIAAKGISISRTTTTAIGSVSAAMPGTIRRKPAGGAI